MAAQQQAYDPTSTQPYTPEQAPPTPEPRESPFQGQPGINMTNMGSVTHGGAIAGVFDNVLRGFVNGYATGEAHKALTLKKKSDDLTASYNADAQRAYEYARQKVAQDGKLDPNDPEYQKLKSAVDGSWGALQDFRGTLLEQSGGKKKGKKQDQQLPPVAVLTNPKSTQQEKAQAYYDLSRKAGPPLFGQIQSLVAWAQSPQAQQQRQTQATLGQAGAVGAQNTLDKQQAQAVYDKYAGWTDADWAKLPEDQRAVEQQKFRNAQAIVVPQPKETGTTREYVSPDGKSTAWYVPGTEPKDWNAYNKPSASATPKLGSLGAAMTEYATENGLDPEKMPLEAQNYVRELWAWEGRGDTSSTTTTLKQDDQHRWVPITEVNSRDRGPKPAPPRGMKAFSLGDEPLPVPESYPLTITQSLVGKQIPGLVQPGNIDLRTRPNIQNPDGTRSSVFSMSSEVDGKEVLYPGVGDGKTYPARKLTQAEALDQYKKTGNNLGTFKDATAANLYAQKLHEDQSKYGNNGTAPSPSGPTRRAKPPRATAAPTGTATPPSSPQKGHVSVGQPLMGAPDASLTKLEEDANTKKVQLGIAKNAFLHLNPASSNDILMAYTRSQIQGAGRLNDIEVKRNLAAGTYGERLSSMYSQFIDGTMNTTMLRNMVNEMESAAKETQKAYEEERLNREIGTVMGGSKKTPSNLPQRPQDVPDNYIYFNASDGTGHWIDPKNLDAAKKIDPKLQVVQ